MTNVFHFPAHGSDPMQPIHRTTSRVGIFVPAPPRLRSTGPQARLHPYLADEERAVRRQVGRALRHCAAVAAFVTVGAMARRVFLGGVL